MINLPLVLFCDEEKVTRKSLRYPWSWKCFEHHYIFYSKNICEVLWWPTLWWKVPSTAKRLFKGIELLEEKFWCIFIVQLAFCEWIRWKLAMRGSRWEMNVCVCAWYPCYNVLLGRKDGFKCASNEAQIKEKHRREIRHENCIDF